MEMEIRLVAALLAVTSLGCATGKSPGPVSSAKGTEEPCLPLNEGVTLTVSVQVDGTYDLDLPDVPMQVFYKVTSIDEEGVNLTYLPNPTVAGPVRLEGEWKASFSETKRETGIFLGFNIKAEKTPNPRVARLVVSNLCLVSDAIATPVVHEVRVGDFVGVGGPGNAYGFVVAMIDEAGVAFTASPRLFKGSDGKDEVEGQDFTINYGDERREVGKPYPMLLQVERGARPGTAKLAVEAAYGNLMKLRRNRR